MPGSPPARYRNLLRDADDDPLAGLTNLFDVVMVFAVAILLSLLTRAPLLGRLSPQDAANLARHPGEPNSELIPQEGEQLQHYSVSDNQLRGQGERLGVAYRLENGEVVYVPNAE